jgi:hypothetical protein
MSQNIMVCWRRSVPHSALTCEYRPQALDCRCRFGRAYREADFAMIKAELEDLSRGLVRFGLDSGQRAVRWKRQWIG